jgi:hypothetical protein
MAFVATMVCSMALLMSCSDSDDASAQEDSSVAECTIIYYGNGGGNLDANMHDNLRQLYRGLRDHSNMEAVVFIKNSADPDAKMMKKFEEKGFDFRPATTYRFVVDRSLADNTQLQFTKENVYGGEGANMDISIADTLAHYISYAAKVRPARHYILIMSNHGGGYVPQDDRPQTLEPTRGILYDDGHSGQCLSVRAIRTAIERSGVSFNAVYLDACLMNCLETLYELNEVTPYIVSATYYTPDVGGEYTCLVNRLANSQDYGQALAGYCDDVANYWLRCEDAGINPGDYNASDINVISSAQLRSAAPALKAFIDQLTQDYSNTQLAQEIDAVTARAIANEETSPLYDLYAYFDDLTKSVSSTALADAARKAKDAMMKCKLNSRGTKATEERGQPSFNFLLGANSSWERLRIDNNTKRLLYTTTYHWDGTMLITSYGANGNMTDKKEGKWGSTGDETYAKLRFEQLTGWSRWLKTNKQKPLSQYPK